MSDRLWLLRHGDTEWSERELHTGRQDVPLNGRGREQARSAGRRLGGLQFDRVLVSPQGRALETCELAGFGDRAVVCDELVEWDYGEYEGLSDAQTQQRHPGWELFRDGAPGGESPAEVAARLSELLSATEEIPGPCLLVSHGKLLRALAAVWIEAEIALGAALPYDPAAISLLERESRQPLLRLWNYANELEGD